jgi:hypothetical protein
LKETKHIAAPQKNPSEKNNDTEADYKGPHFDQKNAKAESWGQTVSLLWEVPLTPALSPRRGEAMAVPLL